MRILFTGASSFTGVWLVRSLAEHGHDVVATFQKSKDEYDGLRGRRVALVGQVAERCFGMSFGDDAFLGLLTERPFDALCHHAAMATDYRSPDFDVPAALAANTKRAAMVLRMLRERGSGHFVLTGTMFEHDEGAGEGPREAFSPYGLSKGLTAATFRYYAQREQVALRKFVIPNPFGPYEEPRFTTFLAKSWLAGKTPTVATPAYIRDNIHVSLLARAYVQFVEGDPSLARFAPTGYVESQGAFARRFAEAMRPRLGVDCPLEFTDQRSFEEPWVRLNTDRVTAPEWSEEAAWDELAGYYSEDAANGD